MAQNPEIPCGKSSTNDACDTCFALGVEQASNKLGRLPSSLIVKAENNAYLHSAPHGHELLGCKDRRRIIANRVLEFCETRLNEPERPTLDFISNTLEREYLEQLLSNPRYSRQPITQQVLEEIGREIPVELATWGLPTDEEASLIEYDIVDSLADLQTGDPGTMKDKFLNEPSLFSGLGGIIAVSAAHHPAKNRLQALFPELYRGLTHYAQSVSSIPFRFQGQFYNGLLRPENVSTATAFLVADQLMQRLARPLDGELQRARVDAYFEQDNLPAYADLPPSQESHVSARTLLQQ